MTPAQFVTALLQLPPLPNIFNPWKDVDGRYDIGASAPNIRREQMRRYLEARLGRAKILLCAEAPGWQGGKFSGIAMTSERILLDKHRQVATDDVFNGTGTRTSLLEKVGCPGGVTEPTATMVWTRLLELGLDPRTVVLWNAMPCHPYQPSPGSALPELNNRTPKVHEVDAYAHIMPQMLELFPEVKVIAVGDVSRDHLKKMGIAAPAVRHPANGGAPRFRSELAVALGIKTKPTEQV